MLDRLQSVGDDKESRLARLLDTWALIRGLAEDLGPTLDLEVVLKTALTGMRRVVEFRGGSIQLIDERGIYVAAAHPAVSPEVAAARIPLGRGLAGHIIATGQPAYSPNLDQDDRVDPEMRSLGSNQGIGSYLGVPLICLGETIGVMQVDRPDPDAFDEDDLTMLGSLATLVAGAIESARRFEQVMELERLKGDFIARVSHELRTPITIIDGFLSTMLSYGDQIAADRQRMMLERSQAAVSRLGGLIEDLITLSRLETGVLTMRPVDAVIADVVADAVARTASQDLVTVDAPAGVTVFTDPELLRRAIGFVVDNAVKYGGSATVGVSGDGRTITVGDRGPGIPDDVRDTVFELFTRSGATTHIPGLGIGLPMARTLLDVLGASIRLGAATGGGTEVVIQLR